MFKVIPPNLKAEEDRREQEVLEDFPAEQAVDPDPPWCKRRRTYGDKGDPQRGSRITFK